MSIEAAIEFSLRAHAAQHREGVYPLPYVTHPIEVLLNLRYTGGVTDTAMLQAAVLHDTVETGRCSLEQIAKQFGHQVAGLVAELTRSEPDETQTSGLSKPEIWELRSTMLLSDIRRMSAEAQTIKLADRLSNVQDAVRLKSPKKLKRYLGQTRQILEIVPKAVNPGLWDAIYAECSVK